MADSTSTRAPANANTLTSLTKAASSDCIVAIDPGSAKCGLAVVSRDGAIPFRSIVATPNLTDELLRVVNVYRPVEIIVGNGTGSKPLLESVRKTLSASIPIRSVPESHTSEEARKRFIMEVPPRGIQRLLPRTLRTPSRPYDDYVAVILGERYWQFVLDEADSNPPEVAQEDKKL